MGTDIEAVNHVVGVPLPGHPEMGSKELKFPSAHTCSLSPQAWEPGPQFPVIFQAMGPNLTLDFSVSYVTNPPESTFRLLA